MRPILYYGNLLLSGTLTGSNSSTNNPVRQVDDGSVNLPYDVTADISASLHSGSVLVALATAQVPVALSIPKGIIPSGFTLRLQSMSDANETGLTNVHTVTFATETLSYLTEVSGSAATHWRVLLSGVSGLVPAQAHEIQLATVRAELGVVQVGIDRAHVRQYSRIAIPGGQPFVRRDGPLLKRYTYPLIAVSGIVDEAVTDNAVLNAFILAVEGGDSFTLTDDLGSSYWAELLDAEPVERDAAGVSSWVLTFQEIKVDG